MDIKEIIQQDKKSFEEKFPPEKDFVDICVDRKELLNAHTQSLKSLIDAIIEDEENPANHRKFAKGAEHAKAFYLLAKQDTINKLKAIKELL